MRQELRHLTTRVSPTVVGRASKVEDKSMERKGLTPEQVADTFKWDRKYGSSSLTSCIMVKLWYRNDLRHYKPRLDQHDRLYVNTGFYSKGREYITDCSIISCDFAGKVSFTYLVTKPEPKPTPQPTEDKSMERNELRTAHDRMQAALQDQSEAVAKGLNRNELEPYDRKVEQAHDQFADVLREHQRRLPASATKSLYSRWLYNNGSGVQEAGLYLTYWQALRQATVHSNMMGLKRIGDNTEPMPGQWSMYPASFLS